MPAALTLPMFYIASTDYMGILRDVPSRSSSRFSTPEYTDEMAQAEVIDAYNALLALGGRPP